MPATLACDVMLIVFFTLSTPSVSVGCSIGHRSEPLVSRVQSSSSQVCIQLGCCCRGLQIIIGWPFDGGCPVYPIGRV
jgi:hypothetical protein